MFFHTFPNMLFIFKNTALSLVYAFEQIMKLLSIIRVIDKTFLKSCCDRECFEIQQVFFGKIVCSIRNSEIQFFKIILTFALVVLGWIIFRATGMPSLFHYLEGMLQWGTLRASYRFFLPDFNLVYPTNLFIVIMLVCEWLSRDKEHTLEDIQNVKIFRSRITRVILYGIFLFAIFALRGGAVDFIYFQF